MGAIEIHHDWKWILLNAWSVRLLAASLVLDGVEVAIQIAIAFSVKPPIPAGVFAALGMLVTVAAGVARFVVQQRNAK